MTLRRLLLALACLPALIGAPAAANPPMFWDSKERLPRPDLSELPRLRFLTTTDFPPFNYLDGNGRLSGFHVDLARAICAELEITEKCQIQALPWTELVEALGQGNGEAILAGIAVTEQTRAIYAFSRPYLQFPGRFVMPRSTAVSEPVADRLAGKRVGVIARSGHERLLRDHFPGLQPVTYSRREWLYDDLLGGKIDAAFDDGMRLAFWLAGSASKGCCRFAGGPYLAPDYFGTGMAIAVRPDDVDLRQALDSALQQIAVKGTFAELYLRYFPISFF